MRREIIRVRFGSGEVSRYVMHSLTLSVGNKTIQGLRLGLVLGYTKTLDINFPLCAYLGLSMGREDGLPTFLEELRRKNVISKLSYSIQADNGGDAYISGTLSLGDSHRNAASYVSFSGDLAFFGKEITIPMWPLRILNYHGDLSRQRNVTGDTLRRHAPESAIVDTGDSSIVLPPSDFDRIIRVTKDAISRKMLAIDKPIWSNPLTGFNMVKEEAVPYLPTLAFDIGEAPHMVDIRIKPEHYVHSCRSGTCVIDIHPQGTGIATLGHPIFRAYTVKFDLTDSRVYFLPLVEKWKLASAVSRAVLKL